MPFEFDADEQLIVDWPVVIHKPQNGGTTQAIKSTVTFRILNDDELKEVTREKIMACIHGWDFVDNNKQPLPCNDDTKQALMKHKYIERALGVGLVNASLGIAEKN